MNDSVNKKNLQSRLRF